MKLKPYKRYLITLLIWIVATVVLFFLFYKVNPAVHKRIYIFSFLFGAELYLWLRVKEVFLNLQQNEGRGKRLLQLLSTILYWLPAAVAFLSLVVAYIVGVGNLDKTIYSNTLGLILMIYLAKAIACALLVVAECVALWRKRSAEAVVHVRKRIMPVALALFLLTIIAILPFYAMRDHFRTTRQVWEILPSDFAIDSLKAIHISDLHLASWQGTEAMEKLVKQVNRECADFIFITGDLVHFTSDEIVPYLQILNQLHAKFGIFSIMGNHDYSRYAHFDTDAERNEDVKRNVALQEQMGWTILRNENQKITVDSLGNTVTVAGLEYWAPSQPAISFGDFEQTYRNVADSDFVVLLTHAPQGWRDALARNYPAQITLSGHTHGMQIGILTDKFKLSPGAVRYKEWGGKYEKDGNILYVNVGLASAGIPIRVGMLPEIGVYTWRKMAQVKN